MFVSLAAQNLSTFSWKLNYDFIVANYNSGWKIYYRVKRCTNAFMCQQLTEFAIVLLHFSVFSLQCCRTLYRCRPKRNRMKLKIVPLKKLNNFKHTERVTNIRFIFIHCQFDTVRDCLWMRIWNRISVSVPKTISMFTV